LGYIAFFISVPISQNNYLYKKEYASSFVIPILSPKTTPIFAPWILVLIASMIANYSYLSASISPTQLPFPTSSYRAASIHSSGALMIFDQSI